MNTARLNQGTPLLLNAVSKHYAENIVLNQLDLHIPVSYTHLTLPTTPYV